jgi:hypothetical protein
LLTKRKRTSGNNLVQKRTTEIASSSVGGVGGAKRSIVNQRADPSEENKEKNQANAMRQNRELIID